jgi:putative NADH-flavin reductase
LSVVKVDILDPASVAEAVADVDVVVNATSGRASADMHASSETLTEKENEAAFPSVSYRVVRLRRMTSLGNKRVESCQ